MSNVTEDLRHRIIDTCLMMESDLMYPHTIETLAAYAAMSTYHFKHSFKKVVGESAIAHLKRLRLGRAAMILKSSDIPVTQIAFDADFATHSGFTKAFTKHYGCSPAEYRDQQMLSPYVVLPPHRPTKVDVKALAKCPLSVSIRREPTRRLAVKRYVGPTEGMASIWPEMIAWCRERNLMDSSTEFFGLHQDDWDNENNEEDCLYRYDAAVAIDRSMAVDAGTSVTFLPGGDVATVAFQGTLKEMDRTWHTFVYDWLPASGYQPRLWLVYDRYPSKLFNGGRLKQIVSTLRGIQAELSIPVSVVPVPLL